MHKQICHRILLVEDNEDLRNLESEILEAEGYKVDVATNGQEALDVLNQTRHNPCLILLDLMMPIMNGMQFLNIMKANPLYANIPVLIVSAVAKHSKIDGVVGHMQKPINLDKLFDIVEKYCQKSK